MSISTGLFAAFKNRLSDIVSVKKKTKKGARKKLKHVYKVTEAADVVTFQCQEISFHFFIACLEVTGLHFPCKCLAASKRPGHVRFCLVEFLLVLTV